MCIQEQRWSQANLLAIRIYMYIIILSISLLVTIILVRCSYSTWTVVVLNLLQKQKADTLSIRKAKKQKYNLDQRDIYFPCVLLMSSACKQKGNAAMFAMLWLNGLIGSVPVSLLQHSRKLLYGHGPSCQWCCIMHHYGILFYSPHWLVSTNEHV